MILEDNWTSILPCFAYWYPKIRLISSTTCSGKICVTLCYNHWLRWHPLIQWIQQMIPYDSIQWKVSTIIPPMDIDRERVDFEWKLSFQDPKKHVRLYETFRWSPIWRIQNDLTWRGHTMWGPPVINWFINPSNYSYLRTINHSEIGVMFTNLAIVWGPHFAGMMGKLTPNWGAGRKACRVAAAWHCSLASRKWWGTCDKLVVSTLW